MTDGAPTLVVLAGGRARRYGGCKPLAPVGPAGEAVLDLVASDAVAAGFGTIVLVVGPSTGPAIRYHVTRTWPASVDVRFAVQEVPLGTVHAVLTAAEHLVEGAAFGVANADDVYGADGLALLRHSLQADPGGNAVVPYRLSRAVISDAPVTRGVCEVRDDRLVRVEERREVRPLGGGRFAAGDGKQPAQLDGDTLVSVNLWGFGPDMRKVLEAAMAEAEHASEDAEVLLPEVVGRVLAGERPGGIDPPPFAVSPSPGRCVGVTHPDDLPLVQAELARQVGAGQRAAGLWAAAR